MVRPIIVMTNLPDLQSAKALARNIVEKKMAACVNCLPQVASVYQWQGKIEEAEEVSLLIKTTGESYADLEAEIRSMHPYELPEIIVLPIEQGLPAYLDWISRETKRNSNA